MSRATATDALDLLARHTPVLRYDSRERFTAVGVQNWTDGADAIAASTLDPASLVGPQDTTPEDARMYGHVATGSDGRVWLSYWFLYLYNEYTLLGPWLGAGRHEGDWEMIQMRLGIDNQTPDLALYTQHSQVERRHWQHVERMGEHPVIYVARGCHASYFSPGWHWTGVWFDRADGRCSAPQPELEVITDGDPQYEWVHWPGRWGSTRPGRGIGNLLGLDASSPHGPGHQRQWKDPAKLLETAMSRRTPRWRASRLQANGLKVHAPDNSGQRSSGC